MFQSTHPHGVRPCDMGSKPFPLVVSIHAPTRGATSPSLSPRIRIRVSIHAPTRGATIIDMYYAPHILVSIHAPTRGATFLVQIRDGYIDMFQSTHPHGVRRSDGRVYSDDWSVSIHAPTRGATRSKRSGIFTFKVSIHAPTRGATARERQGHHI